MSDAANRPKPRPRVSAEQKAEWDAAFGAAVKQPVVDPSDARVYGILALCVAVFGSMTTAAIFWLTPTGGLSLLLLSAIVASRFSRMSGTSEFGQRAARWSYWMYVILPVATLLSMGMSLFSMDVSRYLPDIQIQLPKGLLE